MAEASRSKAKFGRSEAKFGPIRALPRPCCAGPRPIWAGPRAIVGRSDADFPRADAEFDPSAANSGRSEPLRGQEAKFGPSRRYRCEAEFGRSPTLAVPRTKLADAKQTFVAPRLSCSEATCRQSEAAEPRLNLPGPRPRLPPGLILVDPRPHLDDPSPSDPRLNFPDPGPMLTSLRPIVADPRGEAWRASGEEVGRRARVHPQRPCERDKA